MINNIRDIINFFQMLQLAHSGLNSFFFDNDKRIKDAERSTITYPYLWLEEVTRTYNDNVVGHIWGPYRCHIIIGTNTQDDLESDLDALADTESLMEELIIKIKEYREAEKLEIDIGRVSMITTEMDHGDHVKGWDLTLDIMKKPVNYPTPDASIWHDTKVYEMATGAAGDIAMTVNGVESSIAWDGLASTKDNYLKRFANTLNAASNDANAITFGGILFITHSIANTTLTVDTTASDFTFTEKLT